MAPVSSTLGPLAQVELPLKPLKTAVYLAKGPHGWHKAAERLDALEQLLVVSGAELAPSSSFDLPTYKDERFVNDMVHGVVVQDEFVDSIPLPEASTGIPDNAGQACIRALTCGLLCFYGADTTVNLLRELIPHALLHPGRGDAELRVEDELLSALQQWVEAVMLEEDANDFRQHLLDEAGEFEASVTGIPPGSLRAMDRININDVPLVLGALKWILWPRAKREPKHYPTCSLKVLTMSFILSKLGFDVVASTSVVYTTEDYMMMTEIDGQTASSPDVFLVSNKADETDFLATFNEELFRGHFEQKWQTTVLEAIPWLTFKHFRGKTPGIDTQYLVDAWNAAFNDIRERSDQMIRHKGQICLTFKPGSPDPAPEQHKAILHYFSPHFYRLCGAVMREYGPASPDEPGWGLQDINEGLRMLASGHCFSKRNCHDVRVRDHCHVIIAIVMGTIYGLCSNFCLEHNRTLGPGGEVVFQADAVFDGRLKNWARLVGSACSTGGVGQTEWSGLIFELFLGARSTVSLTPSKQLSRRDSITSTTASPSPTTQPLILGAQANGMTAVADALVHMSIHNTALLFHLRRGQLLNLPLTSTNHIVASSHVESTKTLSLSPQPATETYSLHPFDAGCTGDTTTTPGAPSLPTTLSLTADPAWEADPRHVLFRLHSTSSNAAATRPHHTTPLNIPLVLSTSPVPCRCARSRDTVAVPLRERWRFVHFGQLLREREGAESRRRADLDAVPGQRVLVDTSWSRAATVGALGVLQCRNLLGDTNALRGDQ
ncbi:hypothetical protein K432DRAFT_410152 [Neofusicoccum parvum]|uniref:Uncharacterized protein n=1 Tax=Neofusicoccum parvum TaxID=310453 RepID=A0ACB5RYT1_9PEZI|nr:hypothetical protein K432DRAFT_410152 [Neofusicoccum parvum]